MRKAIRDGCDSGKPWIDVAWELAEQGIPQNLIEMESNNYGKSKIRFSDS
jgi:hypothetical protein